MIKKNMCTLLTGAVLQEREKNNIMCNRLPGRRAPNYLPN